MAITFKIDFPNPKQEWLKSFVESLPNFHRLRLDGYEFRRETKVQNPDFVIVITESGIKFTDYHHGGGRELLGLLVEELAGRGGAIQIEEL